MNSQQQAQSECAFIDLWWGEEKNLKRKREGERERGERERERERARGTLSDG